MKKKIAVILFNLGGPSNLDSVEKFLFNLFYDKSIINLPNPFRWMIAKIISFQRNKEAQAIYSKMGGKSPILENTENQAKKLEVLLDDYRNGNEFKVFTSMRYSYPRVKNTIEKIDLFNPDEIVLLPLYPQLSKTTTVSSIKDFFSYYKKNTKTKIICCYYEQDDFINSHVNLIKKHTKDLDINKTRFLFSAHSLPESIIKEGDPYQWQIEQAVEKIVKKLDITNLDYKICYQSKIGPVKWLSPFTEEEVKSCFDKNIVLIPIAFVSEHSETLVELDIDYKDLAQKSGCRQYVRIPALGTEKSFIEGLKNMVIKTLEENKVIFSFNEKESSCPSHYKYCLCKGVING